MQPTRGNLFADAAAGDGEIFTTLYASAAMRIERIASRAQASPPGFWYDQAGDEWVAVLRGHAALEFDDGSIVALSPGDWITIPAHARHRVRRTDDDTLWLAVHA